MRQRIALPTWSFPPAARRQLVSGARGLGSKQKESRNVIMNYRPDLRLITQIARLYHEERLTQIEIAKKLGISQVGISRFLKKALECQIVRTTVISPVGAFLDLEELLEKKFGLRQVLIAEASRDSEEAILAAVGATAAHFLETTVRSGEIIGVSDWKECLLSTVQHLRPMRRNQNCKAVQMVGAVGSPSAQEDANHLTNQLAVLIRAEPCLLPAPGIVGSASSVKILGNDPYISKTMRLFDQIGIALLEISPAEPSSTGSSSRKSAEPAFFPDKEAVGAICLRPFDADGVEVRDSLGDRIVGVPLEHLKKIPRAIGIAGGKPKFRAILGALRGRWINVLITDQFTAKRLTMA
jgi:DNA-binding transcriptional regulator LsrR (DeoR family)